MARRRLRGAIAGGMQGLSQALQMMMQNKLIMERQLQTSTATGDRATLDELDKINPDFVSKFGPDAAKTTAQGLRRRLSPAQLKGMGGETDYSQMEAPVSSRLEPMRRRISEFNTPEDAPSEYALRGMMDSARVPADTVKDPTTTPGFGGFPMVTGGELAPSDALTQAMEEVKRRSGALGAQREAGTEQMIPGIKDGVTVTTSMTRGQRQAAGSMPTERTTDQQAAREGTIAGATEGARLAAQTTPKVIKAFADKAGAEAYARQLATNTVDQKMGAGSFKPTTQVVEGQDDQGNKVFQVIDTSPGKVGTQTTMGGMPATQPERTAYAYLSRAQQEHEIMLQLEPILARRGLGISLLEVNTPESITDPTRRQYAQATRRYINAGLGRPESGGAITTTEFRDYGGANALSAGDDSVSLANKQKARSSTLSGLVVQSGKLGSAFVTYAEVAADAAARGVPVEQAVAEAKRDNLKVIR